MGISVIDKIEPLGNFPVADAEDIDCNGTRLDAVLNASAVELSKKASKTYVDEQIAGIPKGDVTKEYVDNNFAKKSDIPTVPTKTSQLQNDSGFLTQHQSLAEYAKKTDIPVVPTKVSAFENDKGYLTQHQSLAGYVQTTDSRLTDARPASDVYDWAKRPIKPTYTPEEIGLGNVNNTSDIDKPISAATQEELDKKAEASRVSDLAVKVESVEEEQTVLNSRIDNIISIPAGSIDNVRLEDICVKADGTTADSPGNAVREQISEVSAACTDNYNIIKNATWSIGKSTGNKASSYPTDLKRCTTNMLIATSDFVIVNPNNEVYECAPYFYDENLDLMYFVPNSMRAEGKTWITAKIPNGQRYKLVFRKIGVDVMTTEIKDEIVKAFFSVSPARTDSAIMDIFGFANEYNKQIINARWEIGKSAGTSTTQVNTNEKSCVSSLIIAEHDIVIFNPNPYIYDVRAVYYNDSDRFYKYGDNGYVSVIPKGSKVKITMFRADTATMTVKIKDDMLNLLFGAFDISRVLSVVKPIVEGSEKHNKQILYLKWEIGKSAGPTVSQTNENEKSCVSDVLIAEHDIIVFNPNPELYDVRAVYYSSNGGYYKYGENDYITVIPKDSRVKITMFRTDTGTMTEAVKDEMLSTIFNAYDKSNLYSVINVMNNKINGNNFEVHEITVGESDSDFSNIDEALDSISDNSDTNRYRIVVKSGEYQVPEGKKFFGLKNYVSIIGESKTGTIVKNIASDTVYDSSKSCFDASGYTDKIKYASIENMTIICKGGKCPIHIDTDTAKFADGGVIEIKDCALYDLNTLDMSGIPIRNNNYNAGGVNVGLRGGQTVRVLNTVSNGAIYAHNTANQSKPCEFYVENCDMQTTTWGDIGSNQKDKATFKNNHIQNFYWNNATTSPNVLTVMENNDVGNITSVSSNSANWSDAFAGWNECNSGKIAVIESNIHSRVVNASANVIAAGTLVQIKSYRGTNLSGVHVEPYNGGILYGYAMETIQPNSIGFVQNKNVVEIPNITGISFGDEIEYSGSVYRKKTTGKSVGVYYGSGPYSRNFMKLATK